MNLPLPVVRFFVLLAVGVLSAGVYVAAEPRRNPPPLPSNLPTLAPRSVSQIPSSSEIPEQPTQRPGSSDPPVETPAATPAPTPGLPLPTVSLPPLPVPTVIPRPTPSPTPCIEIPGIRICLDLP